MTLALQQSKTASDTREKLRLNFHSLSVSVSVSELLEYGRMYLKVNEKDKFLLNFMSQQMHVLWLKTKPFGPTSSDGRNNSPQEGILSEYV
jgi:hypothetical protein